MTVLRALTRAWLADAPHGQVEPALAQLLDVRDALHVVTGRGRDRLVREEELKAGETALMIGFGVLAMASRNLDGVAESLDQGIGTALLDVLLSLAKMSGVEAVSLAVEDGNGAKSLYVDRGFATVGRNGDSDLMVRQLR